MMDGSTGPFGLQAALAEAQPLYVLPKDDVTAEVLVPALRSSASLDVMIGYFSSSSFAELAPGLATFLRNTESPLRMVVSPFVTTDDYRVLTNNKAELASFVRRILIDDVPDEDTIVRHTLACFSWLITQGRLLLKVAVMRDALFHPKVWLFDDGSAKAALHGSTNLTRAGLARNREQLTLSRDWKGEEPTFHINRLRREFDDLWSGGDQDCCVLPLPDAVKNDVIARYRPDDVMDEDSLGAIWRKAHGVSPPVSPDALEPAALKVPPHLVYEVGDFAHQGQAVRSWEDAHRRGVLEMATGSGKTITSMICATRVQDETGRLLVVVSAPYRPLIEQWCHEVRQFGVRPTNLTAAGGPKARDREVKQAARRLRMGHTRTEVLVVSHDTLCTERFVHSLTAVPTETLLIADECHNLGVASFIERPPEAFTYRLGLSATPIRQYDEEGTEALFEYFGPVCFSFTLEDAIGKCLTEYDYHVHFVELTSEEMRAWRELTDKIATQAWKLETGRTDAYLQGLLRRRRLVLETASQKLDVLARLLEEGEDFRALRHVLIYTTDKEPRQLQGVNHLLRRRGVLFHQLTHQETQNRHDSERILSAFQNGDIHILTAKRVLDEGVNIPQIKCAYVLASTTVRRQWIQRRGRLLRTCESIGKTHAVIHDFVVLPPGTSSSTIRNTDPDGRRIVRSELDRVWEFAHLSRNGPDPGGPYEAVQHLQELANQLGVT